MSVLESVPAWAALPVSLLLIIEGCIIVTGPLGLMRLPSFYQRIHGPAITVTLGAGSVLIASMIYFTALQSRLVIHEVIITLFVLLTASVDSMMAFGPRKTGRRRSLRPRRQDRLLPSVAPTMSAAGLAATARLAHRHALAHPSAALPLAFARSDSKVTGG